MFRYVNSSNYNSSSSFHLSLRIIVKELLRILMPHLRVSFSSVLSYSSNSNKDDNRVNFNYFEKNKKVVYDKNYSEEEYYLYVFKGLLNLLSFLFMNDWRCCAFYATFINENNFVDSFREDEEFKERRKKISISDICDIYDNDLWLLNEDNKRNYDRSQTYSNLYLEFACEKECNKILIKYFRKKEKYFHNIMNINILKTNILLFKYEDLKKNRSLTEIADCYNKTYYSNRNITEYSIEIKKTNEIINKFKNENNKGDNDNVLDESESESSEEIEEEDEREKNLIISCIRNNIYIPIVIKVLILCLYSENVTIRKNALLTLSSFLDYEKINNEEKSKDLCPSVIYLLCKELDEVFISFALYYNIKYLLRYKEIEVNSEYNYLNYSNILFSIIDQIVEYSFNSNIILSSDEIRRMIQFLCRKDTIIWIGSFYECEEIKMKVIRLLYVLISCSEEDIVFSLFNFEESYVLLFLIEDTGYSISDYMV